MNLLKFELRLLDNYKLQFNGSSAGRFLGYLGISGYATLVAKYCNLDQSRVLVKNGDFEFEVVTTEKLKIKL